MKNRKLLKILLIALAATAAGVAFTMVKGRNSGADEIVYEAESEDSENPDETEGSSEDGTSEEESESSETESSGLICVHVCGAVSNEGVYYLESGSRVHEAVEMAGGLTDEAAQEYVNLARVLEDGEQVYIPTLEEAQNDGLEIAASSESSSSGTSSEDTSQSSLININTATSEELQTLPGIGESKAAAIISYREENGDFESTQDITNVSGIGDSTYENIKDYITV